MTRIAFYLFLKPLSMLPLPVLYGITWPLYFFMSRFLPYRRAVVRKNLRNAFPDKSNKELKAIERGFYRHFADQMLETLKMVSMSDQEGLRRFRVKNPELLNQYHAQGRNVALVIGHYNNWELSAYMNPQINHWYVAIYAQLKNQFMNDLVKGIRSKMGTGLIEKREVGSFLRNPPDNPYMLIFLADQSPSLKSKVHWTRFLNQNTPVATGTERYAKMLNLVVAFGHFTKVKRGHYELTVELISDDPKSEPDGRISELHVQALERQILKAPEYWLWSHKRWKKAKKMPKGAISHT